MNEIDNRKQQQHSNSISCKFNVNECFGKMVEKS